jgi:hypothetical protein
MGPLSSMMGTSDSFLQMAWMSGAAFLFFGIIEVSMWFLYSLGFKHLMDKDDNIFKALSHWKCFYLNIIFGIA